MHTARLYSWRRRLQDRFVSSSYSRAFYEPASARYVAFRIYDDWDWHLQRTKGIVIRTAAVGQNSAHEFIRHTSLEESVAVYLERREALDPKRYEVYANEFLSGALPANPPPKREEHVFLDEVDLGLRRGQRLSSAEHERLAAMSAPWAVLLHFMAEELSVGAGEEWESRLAALLTPRSAWDAADHYAHQFAPIELEGQIEFFIGGLKQRRGALAEAERHLARAHTLLPCTRTCAVHACLLHQLPGRELQAFALASRYGRHGAMEPILADPRLAEFTANRPKKGVRWMQFPVPFSEEELSTAEVRLERALSPAFRAFAKTFGAGTLYRQSPKVDQFLNFEPAASFPEARATFHNWFGGELDTARKELGRLRIDFDDLLPIAAPSNTASYVLLDLRSENCFAWDHDGLFEFSDLGRIDRLLDSLQTAKRWPFA